MPNTPRQPVRLSRGRAAGHVGGFWIGYLVILAVFGFMTGFLPPRVGRLAWGGASAVGLLSLTFWLLRREDRTVDEVGLRWSVGSLWRLLAGLLLGIAVYVIILLTISSIAGPLHVTRATAPTGFAIVSGIATTLLLAVMEEVGFRAYPLWTLVGSFGVWWGQLVVAAAFALVHILYGWSMGAVLLGVFPSALLFGAVAIATRGIACPIGVHVALNLCQWLMGEKSEPGVWHIGMSRLSEPRVAALAPSIGFVVVLGSAIAVTLWWTWRARRARLTAA